MKKKQYKKLMERLDTIGQGMGNIAQTSSTMQREITEIRANVIAIRLDPNITVKRIPDKYRSATRSVARETDETKDVEPPTNVAEE